MEYRVLITLHFCFIVTQKIIIADIIFQKYSLFFLSYKYMLCFNISSFRDYFVEDKITMVNSGKIALKT
jgi:hypothetical protein